MAQEQDAIPPLVRQVIGQARMKHVPRGQILLYQGDTPAQVYIINSGVVKIHDIDDAGNEKILHLVKSPSLIPYSFFSGLPSPLQWFYSTLTDCDVYVIDAGKLSEEVKKNGELYYLLGCDFSQNVHELLVRLSSLGKTNAKDKIIAVLKFLAVCHSTLRHSGWSRVNFSATHQLLADMAGLTRESTALVMKDLQTANIVRNPRMTILEIDTQKLFKSNPV